MVIAFLHQKKLVMYIHGSKVEMNQSITRATTSIVLTHNGDVLALVILLMMTEVKKKAKNRNLYNRAPRLTWDTI